MVGGILTSMADHCHGAPSHAEHDLTTRRVPITALRPHPDNPRNGDTDAIAESLRVNSQYRPIVATTDGTILAGNHTYAAAMELGWDEMAIVTLNIDPASAEAKRIMLADNRTADLGRYDDGLLIDLLQSLQKDGFTLEGTGYTVEDFTVLSGDAFLPDLTGEQPRLDQQQETTCPNCGHTW